MGIPCAGLLGADVLGGFDFLLDARLGRAMISRDELMVDGELVHLDQHLGLPIVSATVHRTVFRFFFDTGARFSYFQHVTLADFPPAGAVTDFYPGLGTFNTDTYQLEVGVGPVRLVLRCGSLPRPLDATLMMAGTHAIIGNQVLGHRITLYAPRRRLLVL